MRIKGRIEKRERNQGWSKGENSLLTVLSNQCVVWTVEPGFQNIARVFSGFFFFTSKLSARLPTVQYGTAASGNLHRGQSLPRAAELPDSNQGLLCATI